jgi:D-threo-aldose 1-dehydrogenase
MADGSGRLGLGTANVGNLYRALTDAEARDVLTAAWEGGVRTFDTAPHYGLGLSEERLGRFLRDRPRNQVVVSTKVGRLLRPDPNWDGGEDTAHDFVVPARLRRIWDLSPAGLLRSLEESLQRLGLDHVDVAYLHDPERHDLDRALDEGLEGLMALRDSGLAAEVGAASMDGGALAAFADTGALDRLMIAGRWTLLDRTAAERVLPACRAHGIAVVAAAVFNSGLLATDRPGVDHLFDYRRPSDEQVARARRLAEVCHGHGVPLPVAALRFPLTDSVVTTVVAGAATPEQARANAAAMAVEVPDALWADVRSEGLLP